MKPLKLLFLLLPAAFSLFCLSAALLLEGMPVEAFSHLGLSLKTGQNLYDTRACASSPNSMNCDGQYPVTIQGTPGVGSGACIDQQTKKFSFLFPEPTHPTEEIDLYWSVTCQSSFAYASTTRSQVSLTIKLIEHSGLVFDVDGAHQEYFNSVQTFGPVKQSSLWSPMKWSPSGHLSAQLIIQDLNGNTIEVLETPQFVGGVQQTVF